MCTISHVVSECQILERHPSAPSRLHAACVFVPGSSGGWFRRIGMEVGSVTVLWWRRSREEWVGREGLYKPSQQLWITNTRDGYRARAANWFEELLSCFFIYVYQQKVWIWRTDSPGEELCFEEEFENAFPAHPNRKPHRMSAHAVMMSHLNAMTLYRMSLAMEEFPQLLGLSRTRDCARARSVLRMKSKFSCGRIAEEVDEEGRLAVEEDKARRSFLQSLESLRRCTQGRQ